MLSWTSSLKQQSVDRHVTPLGHIILILSQSVFALTPWCCMLSGEGTNTNFIVCFDPTTFWTHDILYSRLACWPLPHWCSFYKTKPWYNATFNNISAISCRPVLLVEETELPRPAVSHWQILSHNIVCIEYNSPWAGFELTKLVLIGTDSIGSCESSYHTSLCLIVFHLLARKPNSKVPIY